MAGKAAGIPEPGKEGERGRRSPWNPEFIPGFIPPARRGTQQSLDIPSTSGHTLNFLLQQKQGTKAREKKKEKLICGHSSVPCPALKVMVAIKRICVKLRNGNFP